MCRFSTNCQNADITLYSQNVCCCALLYHIYIKITQTDILLFTALPFALIFQSIMTFLSCFIACWASSKHIDEAGSIVPEPSMAESGSSGATEVLLGFVLIFCFLFLSVYPSCCYLLPIPTVVISSTMDVQMVVSLSVFISKSTEQLHHLPLSLALVCEHYGFSLFSH
jgi:hypothetical protein